MPTPKMFTSSSPEPVNRLLYHVRELRLHRKLRSWRWETLLHYLCGNVTGMVLVNEKDKSDFMWEELDLLLPGRGRKELQTKGCGWPLEAGKGKKTDSSQSFQKERALKSLGVSPNETHFGLLTFRTIGTINLNGLKPLRLWYFVVVAIGN